MRHLVISETLLLLDIWLVSSFQKLKFIRYYFTKALRGHKVLPQFHHFMRTCVAKWYCFSFMAILAQVHIFTFEAFVWSTNYASLASIAFTFGFRKVFNFWKNNVISAFSSLTYQGLAEVPVIKKVRKQLKNVKRWMLILSLVYVSSIYTAKNEVSH